MTQWYYVDLQHQRQGPVAGDALAELFRNGALTRASLVWRENMDQWKPLGEMANELPLPPVPQPVPEPAAPPPVADAEDEDAAERPLTGRAVFTAREPSYQPAPVHVAERGTDSPYAAPRADVGGYAVAAPVRNQHVVYAGFWKRVAASIIDAFAIGIPVAIVVAIVGGLMGWGSSFSNFNQQLFNPGETVLSYLLTALAFAWFHSSTGLMATPGKLAIGIKVVRGDGEKTGFLRAFGRYWAYLLSGLILCVGLIMAAFTERKQGLHDLICDTLVVDKWAFTSQPERQREELGTVTLVVLVIGGLLLAGSIILMVVGIAALASMGR